jgi:hypothetical protein
MLSAGAQQRRRAPAPAPRRINLDAEAPATLSPDAPAGLALGAQAGEARLREVVTAGGFTRFRRAAEAPFNIVL